MSKAPACGRTYLHAFVLVKPFGVELFLLLLFAKARDAHGGHDGRVHIGGELGWSLSVGGLSGRTSCVVAAGPQPARGTGLGKPTDAL